ncbi:tRNA (adenosine(37)-N6)-threonylcarbamoyltransferase complex dimerization subunit type 1 TsaB [Paenibacillus campi]|uniref:tRNA (adenosine(37)-N6)-threonylcarbamoyltransferase complex dimerization subunit type 1 TsaB n=1 Tax=Paenibacillus campi TaxID=3106031 RepID=UPI002AFF4E45|nr:tRNA (adenosine(37)-N6)-threonylcarbamoyltransferase complex dimerization subunit type 1 TsaB [Paenibacillus sp. SGZ-1009]
MNEMNEQPRKRFLVLDTATAAQVVAVMDGNNVLVAESSQADRNHSVGLLDSIARMLETAAVSRRELAGIAVGVGPGSYTGIRIAVTTAKTLAWTLQLPVAGFSSLAALALSGYRQAQTASESITLPAQSVQADETSLDESAVAAATNEQMIDPIIVQAHGADDTAYEYEPIVTARTAAATSWIVPLMDARRGQVYSGLFVAAGNGEPVRLEQDRIVLMDEWVEQLSARYAALSEQERPAFIYIVGDTAVHEQRTSKLAACVGDRLRLLHCSLEAEDAGVVGAATLLSGQSEPAHTLLPNYTQLSEAEANLLRQS